VQTKLKPYKKRATRIIYTCTHYMPYVSATFVTDLPTMSDRRDQLSRKFFNSTLQPTSPLHSLLPTPRDQLPTTRLRAASKFPRIPTRTKKVLVLISLVCPSPLSDLTISSASHYYYCIPLIIVLYYCVLLFYYCSLSCFHLSLASWLLFSNKSSVQFSGLLVFGVMLSYLMSSSGLFDFAVLEFEVT